MSDYSVGMGNPFKNMGMYKTMLLDNPFMCKCGQEMIKFKHMKHCNACENKAQLSNECKSVEPVINAGTDYEGIDWKDMESGINGNEARKIKMLSRSDYYNMLICGYGKGIGKSTTAMIISYYARMQGKSVIFTSQKTAQDKMVSEGEDSYRVSRKLMECDLLILDEIGRGVGKSAFFRGTWHDVIDWRIKYNVPTVLIGNVGGLHRPNGGLIDGAVYASDFFEGDRLKDYKEFIYTGESYRGRR